MGRRLGPAMGYHEAPSSDDWFLISSAPDGAWTWFGEPRALHSGSYTYVGYVDTSGNVCVRAVPDSTHVAGAEIILKAAYDLDDHINPSFWVRPDGKLQAFYARHSPNEGTMRTRVSVNTVASDPTLSGGFAAEVSLDSVLMATTYDYPVPITLSSEGTTYMFWRSVPTGDRGTLVYSTTTDGDTWTQAQPLYVNLTKTQRAYWKIASNFTDRIDFAVTDGSPNTDDPTHLAHFYYDGAWRQSDGTSMGALPAGGFAFADFTPVYTAGNTWVYDISYVAGNPVIVHPTYPTPFSAHRYHYSSWDGAAWNIETIADAGNGIDTDTRVYSGGIALNRADGQIVYASREVSGQYEMFRYTTADAGATWTVEQLTSGSSAKNIRPAAVWSADAGFQVAWMYGTYTGWDAGEFETGLRGAA
jgi:hypothetical protein